MQRQFRSIQGNPSAAKKKTAYFGRRECIIEKLFDFFYDQTDRIFIIGAPVNPFLIFDVFDQSQDSCGDFWGRLDILDRKSTRLNSSHQIISYAVFCLKKKKQPNNMLQL